MTKRCWRRFALLLILPLFGEQLSAQPDPNLGNLLDRYGRGDFAGVTTALESVSNFRLALRQLDKAAVPWIRAEGPQAIPRRRLIAAGFALEVAQAGLKQWEDARIFIEWGCVLLRAGGLPRPEERAWHLAAVALAQGAHDPDFLTNPPQHRTAKPKALEHLRHSAFRFPDEDRLRLAKGVVDEFRTLGSDPKRPQIATQDQVLQVLSRPLTSSETPVEVFERPVAQQMVSMAAGTHVVMPFPARRSLWLWDLADQWKALAERDAIEDEALVRLANTYLRLARPDLALEILKNVPSTPNDPSLTYLARYLTGQAAYRQGDRQTAEKAYRAALVAVPGAQSATVALATLLFLSDSRDDAYELMATPFSTPSPVADPWREYQTGDFRLWPQRLAELRESYRP